MSDEGMKGRDMDWQPIETAPKDGRHVLVTVGDKPGFVAEAYYEEDGDRGWYASNTHHTDYHDGSLFPVTAWMPLPEPAKDADLRRARQAMTEGK